MKTYTSEKNIPADILLMHFGGPTKENEVQGFLRNLFEDPFILRIPGGDFVRSMLAKYISSKRWRKTNEQYKKISYSPINHWTQVQANQIETLLKSKYPDAKVHVINRYTEPRAETVVSQMAQRYKTGERRLFLATLYPHFSHSTAGSSIRDFDLTWRKVFENEPPVSTRVFAWWWHPTYLDYSFKALQQSIDHVIKQHFPKNNKIKILFSAHGLPKKYSQRGDPYLHDIRAHAKILTLRAKDYVKEFYNDLDFQFELSFQSRVGPVEWLKPYTDEKIIELGNQDPNSALVLVPISFVSDHIETLYEMDIEYRHLSEQSKFSSYTRSKMPNGDPEFSKVLFSILEEHGL